MKKPNILIIADKDDVRFLDPKRQSNHWNISWKVLDYNKLHKNIGELQNLVTKHHVDFVVYSRNDQVANRVGIGTVTKKLGTGYSSFSGIDKKDRIGQMVECFNDFMECGRKLDFNLERKKEELPENNTGGTFSLIFDTEQLGGVRYGLPRILGLLNRYDVKATFFVTNLMKKVYPNILEEVQEQGHEVGLHGLCHEYLVGLGQEGQASQIKSMREDFSTEISGTNFIGRMDDTTVHALIDNKLKYYVYPLRCHYRLLSYRQVSTVPSLIRLPEGNIWALPISLETYGSQWFSIRNMVDSAISQSKKCEYRHISILCHLFRDGNLQHAEVTEKLLQYLTRRDFQPIILSELVDTLDKQKSDFLATGELKQYFQKEKGRISLPSSWQDFLSAVPENLALLYKLSRRNHGVF